MIKQAVDYREQMKELYEAECKRAGSSPRQFSQSEATWKPAADVWDGPIERLEAEGTGWFINCNTSAFIVFIYRFYYVTCTAPVITGNWRPSKFHWLIADQKLVVTLSTLYDGILEVKILVIHSQIFIKRPIYCISKQKISHIVVIRGDTTNTSTINNNNKSLFANQSRKLQIHIIRVIQ